MSGDVPDPLTATWPRRTPRVLLRPIADGDVGSITRYRSLPEVTRFLTHEPLDRDAVAERITHRLVGDNGSGQVVRGVVVEMNAEVIGDVTLRVRPGVDGCSHEMWIGYVFAPAVWGRGIATEAVRELIEVARELRLPARAEVQVANLASQRVLVKAGMSLVGTATREERRVYGTDTGTRLA